MQSFLDVPDVSNLHHSKADANGRISQINHLETDVNGYYKAMTMNEINKMQHSYKINLSC